MWETKEHSKKVERKIRESQKKINEFPENPRKMRSPQDQAWATKCNPMVPSEDMKIFGFFNLEQILKLQLWVFFHFLGFKKLWSSIILFKELRIWGDRFNPKLKTLLVFFILWASENSVFYLEYQADESSW